MWSDKQSFLPVDKICFKILELTDDFTLQYEWI